MSVHFPLWRGGTTPFVTRDRFVLRHGGVQTTRRGRLGVVESSRSSNELEPSLEDERLIEAACETLYPAAWRATSLKRRFLLANVDATM
ncbi:hypothetical protein FA13DRAFT_1123212 [Coprinellus micaceus]|uniref:Uncharacterized protein n=1 Tax=Coprinellus micaceus TaxID=71717 RepID=A0A4Y7SXJ6_COPMI|nr:hypothetical protein FA13DRAFT_1123212 [Coprinellus micaceus]